MVPFIPVPVPRGCRRIDTSIQTGSGGNLRHLHFCQIPDPTQTFEHFIHHYLSHLENSGPEPLKDEILTRLDALQCDPAAPELIEVIADDVISHTVTYAA
jgi:hypothetical protein